MRPWGKSTSAQIGFIEALILLSFASSKRAKVTKNPICTLMNLNTKTRSSTLYAKARSVLDSISLNFQRQPEATSNVKFQRSFLTRNELVDLLKRVIFAG